MKIKTVFITLAIEGVDKLFDYPQNVPLPRQGELIIYNEHVGIVSSVKHMISGDVIEIKINTKKI